MNVPRVSIILVNWNRSDEIRACIGHIDALRGREPSFEVIVVDNGSADGSVAGLLRARDAGSIRLLTLARNVGPAEARNRAIAEAAGEYLLFLDSDAILPPGSLALLVERMDDDPEAGILGCRVVNGFNGRLDQWIYAEPAGTHEHREFQTYSFSAAGAIVRAEAIRASGPFWGDLFIYNEEVDLSIRVLRAGYKIWYFPRAEVLHYASPRGRGGSRAYWYYQSRNWIWILYRYYPAPPRWRKVALYAAAYLIKGLLDRQPGAAASGIVAGLRRTGLIAEYPDKMSGDEVRRLDALNRRRRLQIGRA